MIYNLEYAKNGQKSFYEWLESEKGIKYQVDILKVSQSQIIGLCSELYEVVNESKMHKQYDKEVDRERLIEELSDCLSYIAYISLCLDVDLVIETELKQVTNIESLIISLNYDILRLNKTSKVLFARRKIEELIVPQFLNIVYSFGFSMDDLREAYFKKMQSNYKNPKFK